jgi:hypothetical protein
MTKKIFFTKFDIYEYGYHTNQEFYADFETAEKNAKNLLTKKLHAKKVCKIGDCPHTRTI